MNRLTPWWYPAAIAAFALVAGLALLAGWWPLVIGSTVFAVSSGMDWLSFGFAQGMRDQARAENDKLIHDRAAYVRFVEEVAADLERETATPEATPAHVFVLGPSVVHHSGRYDA